MGASTISTGDKPQHETPLRDSAQDARLKLASLNIAYSPDAFITATMNGDSVAVGLFLAAGMDVNAADGNGATALCMAVVKGNLELTKLLLERGADPNIRMKNGKLAGVTPLMVAADGKISGITAALLDKGADPEAVSDIEDTPLMWAVGSGNEANVKLLIPKTRNINAANKEGNTAVDVALMTGHPKIGALLVNAGAKSMTDKVASMMTRQFAQKVKDAVPLSAKSMDQQPVLNAITNGLASLQGEGFSAVQMAEARRQAQKAFKDAVFLIMLSRGHTQKTEEEKKKDAFFEGLYKQVVAQTSSPETAAAQAAAH